MLVVETLIQCANMLKELDVSNCNLGPREVVLLLSPPASPALRMLTIGKNVTGNLSVGAISQFIMITGGHTLRSLDVISNGITDAGAMQLAMGLSSAYPPMRNLIIRRGKEGYALTGIYISDNRIGPRGAEAVFDALATASFMTMNTVDLVDCGIGDGGAAAAGKFILHRSCRYMSLNNNGIHAKGIKALANYIHASDCMLETLYLYQNPLDDDGIACFLDTIMKRNRSVRELYLDVSDIGMRGVRAVKRTTEVHGALRTLTYEGKMANLTAKDMLDHEMGIVPSSEYEEGTRVAPEGGWSDEEN